MLKAFVELADSEEIFCKQIEEIIGVLENLYNEEVIQEGISKDLEEKYVALIELYKDVGGNNSFREVLKNSREPKKAIFELLLTFYNLDVIKMFASIMTLSKVYEALNKGFPGLITEKSKVLNCMQRLPQLILAVTKIIEQVKDEPNICDEMLLSICERLKQIINCYNEYLHKTDPFNDDVWELTDKIIKKLDSSEDSVISGESENLRKKMQEEIKDTANAIIAGLVKKIDHQNNPVAKSGEKIEKAGEIKEVDSASNSSGKKIGTSQAKKFQSSTDRDQYMKLVGGLKLNQGSSGGISGDKFFIPKPKPAEQSNEVKHKIIGAAKKVANDCRSMMFKPGDFSESSDNGNNHQISNGNKKGNNAACSAGTRAKMYGAVK